MRRVTDDGRVLAIVRIEGAPAKNPSFWIKSVRFAHSYQKVGLFWLPQSDTSVSDARIVGPTQLRIEYFDYVVSGVPDASSRQARVR